MSLSGAAGRAGPAICDLDGRGARRSIASGRRGKPRLYGKVGLVLVQKARYYRG